MKNILTIITILISWVTASAQVTYDKVEITNENGYQYIGTHASSAVTKYSNVKDWLYSSIEDFENTILNDNTRGNSIEFKPEVLYDKSDSKSHYLVATVIVECRDDKFRVRLEHIRRKTVTSTCDYLALPRDIYKNRSTSMNQEVKLFDAYRALASKKNLTADEAKKLKDLKRYASMTREEVTEKEMKPYIDLQKAIAALVDGIEKAVMGVR